MKRGKTISCATCGHAFNEDWEKGKTALRCGYEKNGTYKGRVTELYPTGHIAVIASSPAPAWCELVKERKRK